MTPPVRGYRKLQVAVVLAAAAITSGALVGFALGVALAPLGALIAAAAPPWLALSPGAGPSQAPPWLVAAVVTALAVALDVLAVRRGGPRPWSVRRQVPREWSRLFGPVTVAALYGARLGVGPLTILNTWLWWGAALLGGLGGPWTGAATGAAFATARIATLLAVSEWARHDMAVRMARVRRLDLQRAGRGRPGDQAR